MNTSREIAAYNAGVRDTAALARAAADKLAVREPAQRVASALTALDGVAAGAAALMLPLPGSVSLRRLSEVVARRPETGAVDSS